jgi:hypothetical protein
MEQDRMAPTRSQHRRPSTDSPLTTTIEVDRNPIVALRHEAAKRDTTVPNLINRLLTLTVTDKLTTAILDDQP